MKNYLIIACLIILSAGCNTDSTKPEGGGGGTTTGGGQGNPAGRGEVSFRTVDGWTIFADFSPAPGSTQAIILMHMRNGTAADWKQLIPPLNKAGYTTLAVDARGAGRSIGKSNGDNAPWDTITDISAARAFLASKGYGSRRVSIIGASYGANNALLASAKGPAASNLVLLSPGEDYHGLKIAEAANKNRARTLALFAKGDTSTGKAADILKAEGSTVEKIEGSEHGTAMLASHSEVLDHIITFLK